MSTVNACAFVNDAVGINFPSDPLNNPNWHHAIISPCKSLYPNDRSVKL